MLVDIVTEFAGRSCAPPRPADEACAAPDDLLKASLEIGLPILGGPEDLGGIAAERSAARRRPRPRGAGHGDMGSRSSLLSPGAVATALSLWGTEEQQNTYLPAFHR